MKKLVIFALLLLVPLAIATEEERGTPKLCYQNYTAIICGFQDILNPDNYCKNINLTIEDCYTEGNNFTVIFSGISYFKMPGDISSTEISRLVFNYYSRSWAWLGEQNNIPLPENSTISAINETTFIVVSNLPGKKVESVQITVPGCYNQVNSDKEKIYPKTQAGKICRIKTTSSEENVQLEPAEEIAETTTETELKKEWGINKNGILLAVAVILIIAAVLVLRAKKQKTTKK